MTPEEIFNQQVWKILQGIKEELLATVKNKPVKYRVPNIAGVGVIPRDRRIKILYKLEEEGAFKIQRNDQGARIGTADIFYLIIAPEKFNEIYLKYKKLCDVQTKLNDYQDNILRDLQKKDKRESEYNILKRQEAEQALRPVSNIPVSTKISEADKKNEYEERAQRFLANKRQWFLEKLWQIVVELKAEEELIGSSTFKMPLDRFREKKIDLENAKKIFINLDRNELVSVFLTLNTAPDKSLSIASSISDDEQIFFDPKAEVSLTHAFKYLYRDLEAKLHPEKFRGEDPSGLNQVADGLLANFSERNLPFIIAVLKKIADSIEFTPEGKSAHYQLQSPPGDQLIMERRLLRKLSSFGLFKMGAEDGMFGISPISEWNLNLIKRCVNQAEKLLRKKNEEGAENDTKTDDKGKDSKKYDFFICHASEDEDYASDLANKATEADIKVWLDKFNLEWGDSLRSKIDSGLSDSRYGIVIFSKSFLKKKKWTEYELNGLFAYEKPGHKVILPIWHKIKKEDLAEYSASFTDKIAMRSESDSIDKIVKEMKKMLEKSG